MNQVEQLGVLRLKILRALQNHPQSYISLQGSTGIDEQVLPFLLMNMRGLVAGDPNNLGSIWTITAAGAGVLAVNDPRAAGAYK